MTKEEIIENIKEKYGKYLFQESIDAYIKGYLDALCHSYEISWDERDEIEGELNHE